MKVCISEKWQSLLNTEFEKPYFTALTAFLDEAYASTNVYPERKFVFKAFEVTPYDEVKVVILGQDPYHGAGQAHGLSFSVPEGTLLPPSLVNIYKEITAQTGKETPTSGDLTRWTKQGVLLLNATLTVEAGKAASHQKQGWETFTDAVIDILNKSKTPIVFLLWGKPAQLKGRFIDKSKHLVLESPHPSPLSAYRGFFGNGHFIKTNEFLIQHGFSPICW